VVFLKRDKSRVRGVRKYDVGGGKGRGEDSFGGGFSYVLMYKGVHACCIEVFFFIKSFLQIYCCCCVFILRLNHFDRQSNSIVGSSSSTEKSLPYCNGFRSEMDQLSCQLGERTGLLQLCAVMYVGPSILCKQAASKLQEKGLSLSLVNGSSVR